MNFIMNTPTALEREKAEHNAMWRKLRDLEAAGAELRARVNRSPLDRRLRSRLQRNASRRIALEMKILGHAVAVLGPLISEFVAARCAHSPVSLP